MPQRSLHALADRAVTGLHGTSITVGTLLDAFAKAGHAAYVCGGAVRDALAGEVINDVDIAVDATLPRIRDISARVLGDDSITAYLPRFGVLKTGHGDSAIDIAMLRTTDDVQDAPTLADVTYARIGTLEQDARNRDLTINGGFWSPRRGLVDPLGCVARDIDAREFGISADARKAAIDPRLSFRCLLFQARGYRMRADAQAHVRQRLGVDLRAFGDGIDDYLHVLVRGSPDTASAVCDAAVDLVAPDVLATLTEACARVGRR